MNLSYGNPPAIEDCTDIGTVPEAVAPRKIKNEGIFAGDETVGEMYGEEIPALRRAWLVVAHYRPGVRSGDIPVPYSVKISGLGRLVYHNVDPDFPQFGQSDNFAIVKE